MSGGPRSDRSSVAPAKRTILFVEDVLEMREVAIAGLRAHGYVVEGASDGGQAVRHANKQKFDVVIMDLQMPNIDGIEAIRRIRANGGEKRPHVIVLSGVPDARTRQLAFEAGCDQYIVKPIEVDELTAAVSTYFAKRDGRE